MKFYSLLCLFKLCYLIKCKCVKYMTMSMYTASSASLVITLLLDFLCRHNAFLVNLDDMESYEVSLNEANNNN